jgi:transcriptional regulator with GAF, ATPase, and Fis domain
MTDLHSQDHARAGNLARMESSQNSDDVGIAEQLDKLQAFTDSTLSRLSVDDLLVELLGRVRDILDVDTAAILTLNQQGSELEARAACGIEEEVRQGVHIPVGVGFAGRIASTRRAMRLDRVDGTTVANPILWEKGIKVMLGVPLLSGDSVLGVLHVGRLEMRPFTDEDAEMLQVVGDRVAGAIQTRELAIERAAADLLASDLVSVTTRSDAASTGSTERQLSSTGTERGPRTCPLAHVVGFVSSSR